MEIDINRLLNLPERATTDVHANLPDPFITCCFVDDETLFVQLVHSDKDY
jgi:hypothetical protein